jgi:nucleotide-binding universal stress UspA family protein
MPKMYKKILVPLDGSELAECALPHAEKLAKGKGPDTAEVTLVSVTERAEGYRAAESSSEPFVLSGAGGNMGPILQPQRQAAEPVAFGKKEKQAERYLDTITGRLEAEGIKVRTEVLTWPPAEAIVSYAEQNGVDVIVMSSHGRSGPSRRAYGRVAEKILKASRVPVLMIRAPGCVPDK